MSVCQECFRKGVDFTYFDFNPLDKRSEGVVFFPIFINMAAMGAIPLE